MNKTFLSTLILLSSFLTACTGTNSPAPTAEPTAQEMSSNTVTAEGTLHPSPSVELGFAQGGIVNEILVQPGERVIQGAVIARLVGAETVQAELAAAQLEQTLAQQSLDALYRNALLTFAQTEQALLDAQEAYEGEANRWNLGSEDEATDLELSIEDYVIAEENYRDGREKLDDVLDLDEDDRKRSDAQKDFDAEKEALAEAYADLLSAVAENDQPRDEGLVDVLKAIGQLEVAREMQAKLDDANLDSEILAAAKSRLKAANAHVTAAEAAIELYELRAPFKGILLRLDLTAGEAVTPALPIAFLADSSRWIVETKDLAEIDVAKVSSGDVAVIKLDAFPNQEFTGRVIEIDPVGREYLGDITYKVTITLDVPDPRFMWNMTATVNISKLLD